MTPHQVLAACSRLVAVIWGTYTIYRVPELFVHTTYPAMDNRGSVVFLTVIQMSVCVFLWVFPATVARMLLPLREVANSAPPLRLRDWQILGVVLIGLWESAQALPRLIYWVVFLNTPASADYGFALLTPVQRGQFAWAISQLIFGICLMFGARGLTAYLFGTGKDKPAA